MYKKKRKHHIFLLYFFNQCTTKESKFLEGKWIGLVLGSQFTSTVFQESHLLHSLEAHVST